MIKKIDHINVSVTNLEVSTKFFVELFGFQVKAEGKLEGEWIDKVVGLKNVQAQYVQLTLPDTQTNLELIEYHFPIGGKDPKISEANQIGFRHMAFEVKNIETVYQKLKMAGVEMFSELQTYNKKKKLCYFKGPDDIILELAEYS